MATLTNNKKAIDEMEDEILRGAKSSSYSVNGRRRNSVSNASTKYSNSSSLLDAYVKNQKNQSYTLKSSNPSSYGKRDEYIVNSYESIPKYNILDRLTYKSKADAYNEKQSMLDSYRNSKNKQISNFLSANNIPVDTVASLSSNHQSLGKNTRVSDYNRIKGLADSAGIDIKDIISYGEAYTANNTKDDLNKFSNNHGTIGTIASVPFNILGTIENLKTETGNYLSGNPIGNNAAVNARSNMAGRIRNTVSENIESPVGKFAYNVVNSIADNVALMPLGKGKALAGMGLEAFSGSLNEMKDKDVTPNQMMATAATSALIEVLTEKIPLDNLFKVAKSGGKQTVKKVVVDALKNSAAEGTGESISEIANSIADYAINQNESDWTQLVKNYESQGMTKSQAQKQAFKQFGLNAAQAGLAGAVSGGIMSGGASAINMLGGNSNISTDNDSTNAEIADSVDTAKIDTTSRNVIDTQNLVKKEPGKLSNAFKRGIMPEQTAKNFRRVDISQDAYQDIASTMKKSNTDSSVETFVKNMNEKFFGEVVDTHDIAIDDTKVGNYHYRAELNKNSMEKIINDGPISLEKMSVISDIDNVLSQAEYIGSKRQSNSNSGVTGYDYFKSQINLNGEDFTVTFEVEVTSDSDSGRKNRVINKIDIENVNGESITAPEVISNSHVDTSNQVDYNNNVTNNNVILSNRGDIDVINNEQENERSRNEIAGNLRDSSSGSQENDLAMESGRTDGGTDTSLRGAFHVINENSRSALNKIGVTDNEFRETTGNPELFSFALESGKSSNENGVMVDSHTADELRNEGAITFLAKDNMSGGAVMPDGNITAVFKNSKSKSRRAGVDIITTALENGGNKLDCYGKNLLSLYASLGFEPVARVKFNAEYAPEGWDFDKFGMPDIYVMKHNGQSTDLVVSNLESGNIKTYTEAEIENLPYMEYDDAMSYRDSLIAANNNQASLTNQSQTNVVPTENSQNNSNIASSDMLERIRVARENLRAGDSSNQRVRGYNDTLVNKTDAPQELKNEFINNPDFYTQLSNKDTAARANEILANNDIDSAINQYRILLDKKDPVAVPLGYNLSKQLSQSGRLDESVQLVRDMSRALTESGQFSQAAAITLMDNDPEAAKRYLIREIDTLNQKGKEKYGKKWTDFELTESELQQFNNIESGDTDAIKSAYEAVYDRLRKQYPSTMTEKLMEFRRMSMLLNARTNVRNVVSNALLFPVRWTADRVSALGEGVYSLINPKYSRTQSINPIRSKQSKKLASEAFETVKTELLGDNKYEDAKGAIRDKQVFKGSKTAQMLDTITGGAITKANQAMGKNIDPSLLETARNFTYYLLEKGDNVFVKKNFESRMASYLDAQGITDLENIPADAYVLATQEAMKATFKDDTKLANILSNVRRNLGVAGEIVLPFTKTPANLAMRGIDYSPAGAAYGIITLINANSHADIAKGITQLGQSATGTAAIALGYALAESGLITGALSEDKDEAQFQKQQGMLPYAFKIGDNYFSYDWAQPASIPIILGVTLYDSWNNNGDAINGLKQGFLAAADSWLELSPLQNLSDIFGGYGTPAENVWDVLTTDTPLSFIPAQLGAAARIGDTTQRVTYDQTSYLNNLANQAKAKIPGLSQTLPVAYDTWGNPIQRQDSTGEAAFANLLNPGQLGNSNVSPIDDEIRSLYGSTGNASVFPKKASWSYQINGESVKLNNEQYSEFQRIMGQNAYDMASSLINSDTYNALSDEQRVEAIADMYSFADALAKSEVLGYDVENSDTYKKTYSVYKDKGADGVATYFGIKQNLSGSTNADKVNAVNSLNISDEDKGYYLSKLINLSKDAETAYAWNGYEGVYSYYSSKYGNTKYNTTGSESGEMYQRIATYLQGKQNSSQSDMAKRIEEYLNGKKSGNTYVQSAFANVQNGTEQISEEQDMASRIQAYLDSKNK